MLAANQIALSVHTPRYNLHTKEMTIVGADTHVAGGAIMVHVQHCLILQTAAFVLQKVTDNKGFVAPPEPCPVDHFL